MELGQRNRPRTQAERVQEKVAFLTAMLCALATGNLMVDLWKGMFSLAWFAADLVLICNGFIAFQGWRKKRFPLTAIAVVVLLGLAGVSRLFMSA
ncbi:hypothetical protein [Streptomyces longispororuber]|uniref:hypothetical protein n=1 Tax=Streptomyces longispororuber TaxID=68230 RepID=UPI00210913D5|nr:hypothetical protein [Streptomyces longispororuber]MCQ4206725.1 hypothetical protein [Streptomyces longispororuber]